MSISTKIKIKILTKPSFRIVTKIQLRNLNQTSAANLKILTKPWAQNLDQISSSNSEQKFSFIISNSNILNKF